MCCRLECGREGENEENAREGAKKTTDQREKEEEWKKRKNWQTGWWCF